VKKQQLIKGLIIIGAVAGLSACSWVPAKYDYVHNNRDNYKSATTTKPLVIPRGYSSSKFSEYYAVPNPQLAAKADAPKVDLLPPDINVKEIPKQSSWF
jgi:uncharacterized lipoprotein